MRSGREYAARKILVKKSGESNVTRANRKDEW